MGPFAFGESIHLIAAGVSIQSDAVTISLVGILLERDF
jgi:hypothetical protein